MELTILMLVRSFREGDFGLYREALAQLLPYFFANNNVNYARWLTIHLRDMMCIHQNHPDVAKEFKRGNFVVHKSERSFSGIAIDQAHEQNNAVIKGIFIIMLRISFHIIVLIIFSCKFIFSCV
jgi:hypothetical protein